MASEFTPPAQTSWWLVRHKITKEEVFGFAKTAYFAVQNARRSDKSSPGWTLSECDVELIGQQFPC